MLAAEANVATDDEAKITRRDLLVGAGAVLTGTLAVACTPEHGVHAQARPHSEPSPHGGSMGSASSRTPAIYLPHGGGPWPWIDLGGFGDPAEYERLAVYLRALSPSPAPRAVLCVSAHWEERVPTVMTAAAPPMFYDYYGFPPESYTITWPAPGAPELAARVRALLSAGGIESAEDPARGFDHGTFVPLKLAFPNADVPTIQLSLQRGLDPARHLAIGRAIAPLRDEGVLIVGSGLSYHNMRGFMHPSARASSAAFDAWLGASMALPPAERDAALTRWSEAPSARACHPREEHLLPLMVVAGAAGDDRVSFPYRDQLLGVRVSAVHFG
jgi:aromatic ring-opening dioxygenase catalytic subunit (LigB family)